jgi:hypothetical protein
VAKNSPGASPSPALVAKRGNQWLTRETLEAHLATLLRVEHVAMLLGSGTSIETLGGRSMLQAWQKFETRAKTSHSWLLDRSFVKPAEPPNLEELIDALEICRLEWTRAKHVELPHIEAAQQDLRRELVDAAILQKEFWTQATDDSAVELLRHHRWLLQKICGARQPGQSAPWLFTTNYDLAIEWAAESLGLNYINGFSGLHSRRFSPHNFDLGFRNVLARGEARFGIYNFYLAKLHGSLTWIDDGRDVYEQSSGAVWPRLETFLAGGAEDLRGVMAFPGAAKYMSTVGFVMGELFRRFTDLMARPQTTLIVNGYSCSDEHLNRLLLSALQNPTLQLVLYARSASKISDQLSVPPSRPWIKKLATLSLPQVTIVYGPSASFSEMVTQLPDPAVYDEQAATIRKMLAEAKVETSA